MYLKIMSGEDIPDDDSRATYRLIEGVEEVDFHRRDDGSVYVEALMGDGACHTIYNIMGNVYLMNIEGKTVAHFGPAPYHEQPDPSEGARALMQAVSGDRN